MEHSTRLKILVGFVLTLVSLSSFTLVLSNFSVEKEMSELLIFYEDLVESAFGEPLTAGVILSTRATVKMRSSGECPCGCCVALSKDLMEKTGIQIGQRVILSELGVYSVIGEVEGCRALS